MEIITRINKKWKQMVLLTSVLLIVFMAAYSFVQKDKSYAASYVIRDMDNNDISNPSYTFRKFQDRFTLFSEDGSVDVSRVTWQITNNTVLRFNEDKDNPVTEEDGSSVDVYVTDIGTTGLVVNAYDDEDNVIFSRNYTLNIAFSINEYVGTGNGNDGVTMAKIFSKDNRRALIMYNPGSWIDFGESALTASSYLNLNHGSARQPEDTNISITWESSNKDVIDVNNSAGRVVAIAAGSATLSVTYREGNYDYTDSILVYVRPEVVHNGVSYNNANGINSVTITNGDKLEVSVKFDNNPLESISDKIDWVIARNAVDDNGIQSTVLVRDSRNNGEYKDEANLVWSPAENSYQLKAKAGVYTIQFYVHGTYAGFDEAKAEIPGCRPVSISNQVLVPSDFRNKTILLNVGGQYSLPEGFNVPDYFFDMGCFVVTPDTASAALGSSVDTNDYITWDASNYIITANKVGSVTVTVQATDMCDEIHIPGINVGDKITLTINISDSFKLNISQISMSVGERYILYGTLDSGAVILPEECEWSSNDANETFVKIETNGTQAIITALKSTPINNPVTVTLRWTSSEGVTFVASCMITVTSTSVNPPIPSDAHIFSDYNYNNPVADD